MDKERDWHVRRLRAAGTGDAGDAEDAGDFGGKARRSVTGRSAALGVAAVLLVVGGGVLYGQRAGAAYQPTISQVQAQINSLQGQVDQVGQQFDQVAQQVAAAKARLAAVQRQDGHEQALFLAAQAKLRQVAVASFETANQSSIAGLLTDGDPAQVLRQASLLEELGNADSAKTAEFLAAAQQVATAEANVRRTENGVALLQAQLQDKKTHLNSLLSQANNTLSSLNLQQQQEVAAAAVGGGSFVTSATYAGPLTTPGDRAVAFAYSKLGTWYQWGGTGPQYDCSGLVQAAWAAAGVSIPRTTYAQWSSLPHVSKANLEPGDLVFFNGIGHVGIYVGGGLMIDAPRTGEQVRLLPLDTGWYASSYDGAARP